MTSAVDPYFVSVPKGIFLENYKVCIQTIVDAHNAGARVLSKIKAIFLIKK